MSLNPAFVIGILLAIGLFLLLGIKLLLPNPGSLIAASFSVAGGLTAIAALLRLLLSGNALPISLYFIFGVYIMFVVVSLLCAFVAFIFQRYFANKWASHLLASLLVAGLLHGFTDRWRTTEGFILAFATVVIAYVASLGLDFYYSKLVSRNSQKQ